MAKEFEQTVLKALRSLEEGQGRLQQGVKRLEVLHEETAAKIDTIVEIVGTQRDVMQNLATKDDVAEIRADISTIKQAVKATNQDLRAKAPFTRLKTA